MTHPILRAFMATHMEKRRLPFDRLYETLAISAPAVIPATGLVPEYTTPSSEEEQELLDFRLALQLWRDEASRPNLYSLSRGESWTRFTDSVWPWVQRMLVPSPPRTNLPDAVVEAVRKAQIFPWIGNRRIMDATTPRYASAQCMTPAEWFGSLRGYPEGYGLMEAEGYADINVPYWPTLRCHVCGEFEAEEPVVAAHVGDHLARGDLIARRERAEERKGDGETTKKECLWGGMWFDVEEPRWKGRLRAGADLKAPNEELEPQDTTAKSSWRPGWFSRARERTLIGGCGV